MMVIYGGANEDDGPLSDVWLYDFGSGMWTELAEPSSSSSSSAAAAGASDGPEAREMHVACLAGRSMHVTGGRGRDGTVFQDLWALDLAGIGGGGGGEMMIPRSGSSPPPVSGGGEGVEDGDGDDGGTRRPARAAKKGEDEEGEDDDRVPAGAIARWTRLPPPPSSRCSHGGVNLRSPDDFDDGPLLCFFGGWDGAGTIFGPQDVAAYHVGRGEWSTVAVAATSTSSAEGGGGRDVPPPGPGRFAHACCSRGNRLLMAGGMNATKDLCDLVSLSLRATAV